MNRRLWYTAGAIALVMMIFGGALARFYTDWLWFGEVGYRTVFWTVFTNRVILGVAAGALFFAIVYSNLWLARRLAPPMTGRYGNSGFRIRVGSFASRSFGLLMFAATLGASVLVGLETSMHWLSYQTFVHASSVGAADPIFGQDIGFYLFKLGFLRYIYGWLLFTLVVAALATAFVHYTDRAIDVLAGMPTFAPHVKAHLSILLAAALFVKAWGYRLDAYNMLYSPSGVIFGAGYTDIHARLTAYKILLVIAVLGGILSLVNIRRRGVQLPAAALAILIGASILVGSIYPNIVQQVYVKPNEIARESKYIEYNIEATRRAFNLDVIEKRQFPALSNLTTQDIENNRAIMNSVRLWDYRVLDKTYSQLQELWQHYKISNIDIDRYTINNELRQVTLAARELSIEGDQAAATTWVNRHFQFTHGFGAVMSPVNRSTQEGLPDFFVKGLPPTSSLGINIDTPQIYFGEMTRDFAIVNSGEEEFDYPSEPRPAYTRYAGQGGVPIGGYLQRLAFAWRFSDTSLVLPNPITADSRLMFRRQIQERVQTIFPFMLYDPDPYLVISNGKLYWMQDAYTISQRYPYSTPQDVAQGFQVNYMRNAVKVVIDAYEGTVDFYTADMNDPILKTYDAIFPGVFKPMSEMPEQLRAHIRYPELLFKTQADSLLIYHMQDPQVFYNKGDRWAIPEEIIGTSTEQSRVEPYYVVTKLPGEAKEEFILMRPFTPINKSNMLAWLAAKCDPDDYGRMILYEFPKDRLIYGPAQIESRIRQDPVIAPQLSLWDQRGSRVSRGNLLVVPLEQSLLYVKPLYLESETSKIPELTRVIVAYGNRIVMEPTLDGALERLFGQHGTPSSAPERPVVSGTSSQPSGTPASTDAPTSSSMRELVEQAAKQLERAQDAQRKGDWAGYGEQVRLLEQTIRRLEQESSQ